MENIDWLQHTNDTLLQKNAREKIATLQLFENEIPAVFIVSNLRDDSVVYMSERGRNILGVTLHEIRLPHNEYLKRFFNPEDVPNYVPKIFSLIEKNNSDDMVTFFQQVRPTEKHDWVWYLSSMKIFMRDLEGKPLLTLTMAIPIDSKHHITTKVNKLLSENNFLRQHHVTFSSLTKREKEVLQLMALGLNSCEIAAKLNISEATASTHRRNIRSKLNIQSNYEIIRYAQAFDLI